MESAIISTPATYRAHAIDPQNDYVTGGSKTGFVNFGEAPAVLDPETRKVRAATKKDVDDTVRFVDTLENVVGWERPITAQDLDEQMASIYNAYSFYSYAGGTALLVPALVFVVAFLRNIASTYGSSIAMKRHYFSTTT